MSLGLASAHIGPICPRAASGEGTLVGRIRMQPWSLDRGRAGWAPRASSSRDIQEHPRNADSWAPLQTAETESWGGELCFNKPSM